MWMIEILRCDAANARRDRDICVPASGHTRDLPQDLDAQDRDKPGKCPSCRGQTPPSSQGSEE